MYDALSFSYLLGTLAANNLISSTVSPQISIAWSATLSFSTHWVVQNFSGYKPLDETRKYFALLAGELCRNLNIARSTFLIDQELATTPVCRAPLTTWNPQHPISCKGGWPSLSCESNFNLHSFQFILGPSIALFFYRKSC